MKALVTGSAGHLGEALVRTLRNGGHEVIGVDILPSPFTDHVCSISDRSSIEPLMRGVGVVFHAATLHKPHVVTHSRQAFVDTNVTGTLNLLEESVAVGVKAFVFTSTTSVFGDALVPPLGMPAAWVTEDIQPVPKNIYGVTKTAAENLCQLFSRNHRLPCVILRTSRFFPESDDNKDMRETYSDMNAKVNELLHRRVDVEDVVSAHLLAAEKAASIGFGKYIISATTPFLPKHLQALREDAPAALKQLVPEFAAEYHRRNWNMFPSIDRVYVNERARKELGWQPRYDFGSVMGLLRKDEDYRSPLARLVGSKGYHVEVFAEGPYPV